MQRVGHDIEVVHILFQKYQNVSLWHWCLTKSLFQKHSQHINWDEHFMFSCQYLTKFQHYRKRRRKSERNNIIKIYPPHYLSVTMTHFIHQQTVHTHYIVKNSLNHNKNILPLLHMHPRSHEFITTKLSDTTKIWWMKLIR